MKQISLGILVVLIALAAVSCSEKETPGGVKYKILKAGDGTPTKAGTYLVMDIVLKDSRDSVWFSTTTNGVPTIIAAPDSTKEKDQTEIGVFRVLTKGDCVSFNLPMKSVLSRMRKAAPKGLDEASDFTFIASLQNVWTREQTMQYQEAEWVKSQRKQFVTDSTLIANHLKDNSLEALSTPSGLRYIIQKEGKGEKASNGQTAFVHYAGYSLDGKLFDTSLSSVAKANNLNNGAADQPYPVGINGGRVIQGWNEMLQLMNKGMKVRVYIPSSLGYGPRGMGAIPPNSVMMFDMEVTDIKK